jgi:hypothetical protein
MKKYVTLICITILICGAQNSFAYEKVFDNGSKIIQGGIIVTGVDDGYGENTLVPPLNIAFDYGAKFHDNIPVSFGGMIAYARDSHTEKAGGVEYKWVYDYFFIGFRGAFHFTEIVKVDYLDLYAGIIAGWEFVDDSYSSSNKSSFNSYKAKGDRFTAGLFAGVRYYLTKNVGIFSELTFGGPGLLNIGAAFKL